MRGAAAGRRWRAIAGAVRAQVEGGTSPDEVAARVVEAIRDERFYVLPHPELAVAVKSRMSDILDGRYPRLPRG